LQGLNIHIKKSIEEFWGCKDIADIYFLFNYYQEKFEENNFCIPYKTNLMVKNAALGKMFCYLAWKGLREKGCEFISKIKWPNLQRFILSRKLMI
jgi:hypothetical protein